MNDKFEIKISTSERKITMNKITRILAIVMAIAMVLGMTACGGNADMPETTAAPTDAPTEAINVCETEGHAWVDATCEAPKTCSVCNATEGEALGHEWVEATYNAPKTCSVCAATEGEALVTYFAEHGLDAKLLDKSGEYELPLACGSDDTKTTVAKITVEDHKTIASDETHEALDGYEWKVLTFKMRFSDENAQQYGIAGWNYLWTDSYISKASDPNEDTTGLFEGGMAYPIAWNGVDYADGLLHIAESIGAWEKDEAGNNYLDIVVTVSVRVPVGYDGFVFGLETTDWTWAEGAYLHEAVTDGTLMFCLD